jgi:7,8-dihydro-6-hydroxymethylpterin-pyrophosphokinase
MVGRLVRSSERLTLPHPGIAERVFVLAPWAEIAPDLEIPRLGRVAELRARLAGEPIERLSLDSPRALG